MNPPKSIQSYSSSLSVIKLHKHYKANILDKRYNINLCCIDSLAILNLFTWFENKNLQNTGGFSYMCFE